MKIALLCVGRPGALLRDAIAEYEARVARYWSFEVVEVRALRASRGRTDAEIRRTETERLLARVPESLEVVALTRTGRAVASEALARELGRRALRGDAGLAYLVGGAAGLDLPALPQGARRMSLGPATLPHELARLVLVEQLYRAGTIVRGEPYHRSG